MKAPEAVTWKGNAMPTVSMNPNKRKYILGGLKWIVAKACERNDIGSAVAGQYPLGCSLAWA
jgi:hypothetical protein